MRLKIVIAFAFLLGSIFSTFTSSVNSHESGDSVWVMIDFGNGKVEWAQVDLSDNTTAIKATEEACEELNLDIIVTWSMWGAFISEIGGVSPSDWSWWWGFFIWNQTMDSWRNSQVGAHLVELEDGDIIGWSPAWDFINPVLPTPTPTLKYPWSMFQHDTLNSGSVKNQGPESNSISWVFSTETIELAASAAVAHNKVLINNWGGVFYLNLQGEMIWKNKDVIGGFSPAISSDSVFVGGKDGFLYCLNITSGEFKWKAKITDNPGLSGVTSSPTIDKGKVYVGSFNYSGGPGGLFCLDAKSGSVIWQKETPSSIYFSSPAVYLDKVFVGTMGLYDFSSLKWNAPFGFFCYDSNEGNLIWNISTGGAVGSSATIWEDKVLFTSKDGFLYCLTQSNGELIWKREIGSSVSSCAISEGRLFVGTGEMNKEGRFLCLDSNGDINWEFAPNGAVQGSPAVAGNLVYFGTNVKNGTVYCLDKNKGQLVWQYKVWPQQYIISSPCIVDNKMYIASDNGRLYCFGGKSPSINLSISGGFHDVNFGEDIIFYSNGRENKLNIVDANQNKLVLSIASLSDNVEISKGKSCVIDSDGDGEGDLEILVEQVNTTSQTASLSLEIPEKDDGGANIIMLIIALVVILIIGIVILRKQRIK